jgi:lipid-A-disaccharide synthase
MLVILPFEEDFYKKWNYEVEYVGHPLVEVVDQAVASQPIIPPITASPLNDAHIVALLPGSRRQEVSRKLPIMLEVSKLFPQYTFIVARATSLDDAFYNNLMESYPKVRSVRNKTYELLINAKAALVTSGTATLETALFGVPEVVCYKGSRISYQIAKRLIKIKYISLVNLIMDREVVKELIQDKMNVKQVHAALDQILHNHPVRERMLHDFGELKSLLRKGGNASANAAASIYRYMKKTNAGKILTSQ